MAIEERLKELQEQADPPPGPETALIQLAGGDPSGWNELGLRKQRDQLPRLENEPVLTADLGQLARRVPRRILNQHLSDAQRICVALAIKRQRVDLPFRCNRRLLAEACAKMFGTRLSRKSRTLAVRAGSRKVVFARCDKHSRLSAGIWQDLLHKNKTTYLWLASSEVACLPLKPFARRVRAFVTDAFTRDWLSHWSRRRPIHFELGQEGMQARVRETCLRVARGQFDALVYLTRVFPLLENPDCTGPYQHMQQDKQTVTHRPSGLIMDVSENEWRASMRVCSCKFATLRITRADNIACFGTLWGVLRKLQDSVVIVTTRALPVNAALLELLFDGLRCQVCTSKTQLVLPAKTVLVRSRSVLDAYPNLVWTDGVRRTVACYEVPCL